MVTHSLAQLLYSSYWTVLSTEEETELTDTAVSPGAPRSPCVPSVVPSEFGPDQAHPTPGQVLVDKDITSTPSSLSPPSP